MEVFEKNFGKLVEIGDYYYEFSNMKLKIFIDIDLGCDEEWVTFEDDRSNGKKMIGQTIKKVEIFSATDAGSVTIVAKGGDCNKRSFKHYHNGYYTEEFRYRWDNKRK